MEVVIELVNLCHGFFGAVNQPHQLEVVGQDVMIGFKVVVNKVQRALPECSARHVQQHHRYQRRLTRLNQGQHLQHFIQRAEPSRAHDQPVGLFDEEQFAGEEEVKRQQIGGAKNGGVGALFERQGDVEAQAVIRPSAFVRSCHDASTAARDDHEV